MRAPWVWGVIVGVYGPWHVAHTSTTMRAVPNLSSRRREEALVALGEAIRRVRQARAISQEELALIAEVDRSYLGRVERGDNAVAILTLLRIAGALGVTAAQLLEQAGL